MIPKISVCIPCWEAFGKGAEFLYYSLKVIEAQTFKDVEVIVTDHSKDNSIENVCLNFIDKMNIKYHRVKEKRGSSSYNTNKSIEYSSGEIIKLLQQDDYLATPNALQALVTAFDNPLVKWVATKYIHTCDRKNFFKVYIPTVNPEIATVNTIGCVSCISFRRGCHVMFDDKLIWFFDCEGYHRQILEYGPPLVLDDYGIVNYLHDKQVTNTLCTEQLRNKEYDYVKNKIA